MVESSFSPAPGAEADGELQRPGRNRPRPSQRAAAGDASRGFSHYVSSRTVLAGGCPAVNGQAVAGVSRRITRLR